MGVSDCVRGHGSKEGRERNDESGGRNRRGLLGRLRGKLIDDQRCGAGGERSRCPQRRGRVVFARNVHLLPGDRVRRRNLPRRRGGGRPPLPVGGSSRVSREPSPAARGSNAPAPSTARCSRAFARPRLRCLQNPPLRLQRSRPELPGLTLPVGLPTVDTVHGAA